MDAVGRGRLIGFSIGVRLRSDEHRWSHAGSENLYIDGEATGEAGIVPHYLRAGGGENSFDAAFGGVRHQADTHLYAGIPYLEYGTLVLPSRVTFSVPTGSLSTMRSPSRNPFTSGGEATQTICV